MIRGSPEESSGRTAIDADRVSVLVQRYDALQDRLRELQARIDQHRSNTPCADGVAPDPVASNGQIAAVGQFKMPSPDGLHKCPKLWFIQVEAAFKLSNIFDDATKYRHVLVGLDHTTLQIASDIVEAPPEKEKYDAIKARIIEASGESDESKSRRLSRGIPVSDEKPSRLVQRIENLAADRLGFHRSYFSRDYG